MPTRKETSCSNPCLVNDELRLVVEPFDRAGRESLITAQVENVVTVKTNLIDFDRSRDSAKMHSREAQG